MRTHGWGGDPPASDEEAIARIVGAMRRCSDAKGAPASLMDVAHSLGVTRQTVYRYFSSAAALVTATAIDAAGDLEERLASHVTGILDPGDAVVEMVAYLLESLPSEPYVGLLITPERAGTFVQGVTSPMARAIGHSLLEQLKVDWQASGVTRELLDEFVEHILRIIQSLILDPGEPPRVGDDLRNYLRRWVWDPMHYASSLREFR
jgi:AcrR family transcriptional regulator